MGVSETAMQTLARVTEEQSRPKQCVYAIQEESVYAFVKIGVARNPQKRVKELQTGNPQKLVVRGTTNDMPEGAIHAQLEYIDPFSRVRLKSEWFYPSPPIRQFLASLGIDVEEPKADNPNTKDDPWGWRHPGASKTRYRLRAEAGDAAWA